MIISFFQKNRIDVVVFFLFISSALLGFCLSMTGRETDGLGYAILADKVKRYPVIMHEVREAMRRDGMITEREYDEIAARYPSCFPVGAPDGGETDREGLEILLNTDLQRKALRQAIRQL